MAERESNQTSDTVPANAVVFLIDDDQMFLKSLCALVRSVQLTAAAFSSALDFLDQYEPQGVCCVVADIRMPGMTGLELQEKLQQAGRVPPLIFVTGHGDVSTCARAFKAGAVDFLEKPVNPQVMLEKINQALQLSMRQQAEPQHDFARLSLRLSAKEHEIMQLIVEGFSVKQIAARLNVSIQTVAKHRTHVLTKIGVKNDVELVKMVLAAEQRER